MDNAKEKLINWRKEPVVIRIDGPTNIKKARMLGYRAKQGYVVARTRIRKGKERRKEKRFPDL